LPRRKLNRILNRIPRRFFVKSLLPFRGLYRTFVFFGALLATVAGVAKAQNTCALHSPKGKIEHVIYVQFDNTHFVRDNPNVPSDLEQMPHLLNFLESQGTVLTNHHTPLISHTATDILTSLTGVYGDRHGVPVSNSFRYFKPDGTTSVGVSFAYWTDPIFDPTTSTPTDATFNMLTSDGHNAPAPWVAFTRAGCNVGSVATANTILENIATDIPTVFGAGSEQAQEVANNPGQAFADFVGVGIHCAAGDPLCSVANTGEQDLLKDEPGGYAGYYALYGNKYVAPQISPNGPMTDLNGNVIQDPQGHVGFPGFDGMSATVSLAYVAAMQEHGVPITYAYISDAHDNHPSGPAYGPGSAGYVAALKAYDDAFNKFFSRLAADGITRDNTLFIFTADEGDHFAGGPPSPANCDGVTVPCTYAKIGEINTNLAGLLATEQGITTPFKVHSDDAPTIYITGNPVRTDPVARSFARALDGLTAVSPITGNTDKISQFLADAVEMKILHMVTADPARTPSLVMFGDPDYFFFAGAPNCTSACVTELPGFAWNHGDVQPEIVTTWLGMVGPGVRDDGVDGTTWSDHTDIRPTILLLAGLKDDYGHDGRVLSEALTGAALPPSVTGNGNIFRQLAQSYKQINAPVGQFGRGTLQISNSALISNDSGDATYNQLENNLINLNAQRNSLASQMIQILEDAAFNSKPIDPAVASSLIQQANQLLQQVPH
jgi:hypothetical protein